MRWVRYLVRGKGGGRVKGGDEVGLLVQAAEVTGRVDDSVLFLKGFIGQGLQKYLLSQSILSHLLASSHYLCYNIL